MNIYNQGRYIKHSANQKARWLFVQFNKKQQHVLIAQMSLLYSNLSINQIPFTYHLKDKIINGHWSFDRNIANNLIHQHKYQIIEINLVDGLNGKTSDVRALLRSNEVTVVKNSQNKIIHSNLCMVVSLNKPLIITAYYNKVNDYHKTLNRCNYQSEAIMYS